MNNKNERVMCLDSLIENIRKDINSLKLVEKELTYLKFKDDTTKDEVKDKLLELLELARKVNLVENICVNGLVKL